MEAIDDFVANAQRLIAEASQMFRQSSTPSMLTRSMSSLGGEDTLKAGTTEATPSPGSPPPKTQSRLPPSLSTTTPPRSFTVSSTSPVFSPAMTISPETRRYPPAQSPGTPPISLDSAIRSTHVTDHISPQLLHPTLAKYAKLHATLIRDLRPNVFDDFELLFKMLSFDDLAGSEGSGTSSVSLDLTNCAAYAAAVLVQIEAQLLSLGPQICELLAKQQFLQTWTPNLVKSLQSRVDASIQKRISHNQVPFREDTDSKHHFKTPNQKTIYDNREKVRDAFLTNLNRVISSQNELSSYYSVDDQELNKSFRQCVQSIHPENLAWFARLFVQHLLNVSGDDREFDKEVKMWAAQKRGARSQSGGSQQSNVDKINKLARRMDGSVTLLNPAAAPVFPQPNAYASNGTTFFPRAPGRHSGAGPQGSSFSGPQHHHHSHAGRPTGSFGAESGSLTSTTPGDWWEDLFPRPAERFFPLFLYVADSHALCVNVQICCTSVLEKLSFPVSNKSAVRDELSFAERVASCNVLAKFLAFLTHYPRFASTKAARENRESSLAFESLHQESVEESNRTGPFGLDPREVLIKAIEGRSLTLVVPWVTRYLTSGPARDFGARDAEYMRETFALLALIRKSRTLKEAVRNKAGFGQLRVMTEIDALFQDFGVSIEQLTAGPEYDAVQEKWSGLLDWLEMGFHDQSLDGTDLHFTAVPLDRAATTCVPLERLRQLLLSAASLSANPGFLVGKSKLRRITAETPAKKVAPLLPVAESSSDPIKMMAFSTSPATVTGLQTPSGSLPEQQCKQMIAATFLHHQEEVARVVEFAVQSAPPNILLTALPHAQSYAHKTITCLAGRLDDFLEAESDVLECIMHRIYYDCRRFVTQLVDLSLGHKLQQFRAPVVDIAVTKVEHAIEKLLRRKISEMFATEKDRIMKERERGTRYPGSRSHNSKKS